MREYVRRGKGVVALLTIGIAFGFSLAASPAEACGRPITAEEIQHGIMPSEDNLPCSSTPQGSTRPQRPDPAQDLSYCQNSLNLAKQLGLTEPLIAARAPCARAGMSDEVQRTEAKILQRIQKAEAQRAARLAAAPQKCADAKATVEKLRPAELNILRSRIARLQETWDLNAYYDHNVDETTIQKKIEDASSEIDNMFGSGACHDAGRGDVVAWEKKAALDHEKQKDMLNTQLDKLRDDIKKRKAAGETKPVQPQKQASNQPNDSLRMTGLPVSKPSTLPIARVAPAIGTQLPQNNQSVNCSTITDSSHPSSGPCLSANQNISAATTALQNGSTSQAIQKYRQAVEYLKIANDLDRAKKILEIIAYLEKNLGEANPPPPKNLPVPSPVSEPKRDPPLTTAEPYCIDDPDNSSRKICWQEASNGYCKKWRQNTSGVKLRADPSLPEDAGFSDPAVFSAAIYTQPCPPGADEKFMASRKSAEGHWFVFAGSYRPEESAKLTERVSLLSGNGIATHIIKTENYSKLAPGWRSVVLGPFNKEQAEGRLIAVHAVVHDAFIKEAY